MDTKLILRRSGRRGIILAILFGLSTLLLILVVAMASLNVQTLSSAAREAYVRQAWYAADGGLQYAVEQLKANSALAGTLNGTLPTSGLSYRVQITNNLSGTAAVTAPDGTSVPVGYVWLKSTGTSSRSVSRSSVALAQQAGTAIFSNALYSKGTLSVSGGSQIDAYNSANGAYVNDNKLMYNAPVAASGNVDIQGTNTYIDGNILLASGATVSGTNYSGTVVSGAPVPSEPSVVPPTASSTFSNVTVPGYTLSTVGTTQNVLPPGTYGNLTMSSNGTQVVLQSGTYYFKSGTATNGTSSGSISITGKNATLTAMPTNGPVVVYFDGTFTSAGGSIVNSSAQASLFQIYGTSSATTVSIGGGASTALVLYAPTASVTLSGSGGNGDFFGAINAKSISASGSFDLHYDLAVQNMSLAGLAGGGFSGWTLTGLHRQ